MYVIYLTLFASLSVTHTHIDREIIIITALYNRKQESKMNRISNGIVIYLFLLYLPFVNLHKNEYNRKSPCKITGKISQQMFKRAALLTIIFKAHRSIQLEFNPIHFPTPDATSKNT